MDLEGVDERVVGGVNAAPNQIPYIASLRRPNGNHFCGASIIRPAWVLSAAHCTEGFANNEVGVVVGSVLLNAGGVSHQSDLIVNHPEYNRARLTNDISVVRVSTPFSYSAAVQPIGIGNVRIETATATVSGWGLTQHQGTIPNNLQTLQTAVITNEVCRSSHNIINRQFVHDNVICTFTRAGEGVCQGDSGGSLVIGNYVVGVPSWVIPCGAGFPDAYARVSSHNSWIVSVVGA